jgi:hypothetical protein
VAVDSASSFAEPVERLSLRWARRGVVAVDRGALHSRAVCSCGWQGRPHFMLAVAIHEAHLHSAQNRCSPAVPLIARDLSLRAVTFSTN